MSYCSCMPLLHNTLLSIRNCCYILFLYPSLSHYCFMLFHAPLSIRNCCAILFLYATVTSRSPIYTRLLCRIVPVCHCYITFPYLYETAVPYCSCMPLLHHVPLSIRDCCAVLFLYATVTSRSPLYTKLLCRIVPVCHCYITFPSLYKTTQSYS